MEKRLLTLVLMALFMSNTVNAFCTDSKNGQLLSSGFCLQIDSSVHVSKDDSDQIDQKLQFFNEKFPQLISKIKNRGYRQVSIKPDLSGESGGVVLAEVFKEQKLIVVYEGFFSVLRSNPIFKNIGYSVADIALLHELLHAFDEDNQLISYNYRLLGWDTPGNLSNDAFTLTQFPQLANSWITNTEVAKIKEELIPLLSSSGPWEVYLLAREKVRKSGYPTIYSIVGGPLESFAELGAYIALDPSAPIYIPSKTVKWFQENVLK